MNKVDDSGPIYMCWVCRKGNPGKRDNFSLNKRFGLPNRANSSRSERQKISTFRI